MIKMFLNKFNNLDDKVRNIMINGFKFSFVSLLLSVLILVVYGIYTFPIIYICGTILFKTSLMFFAEFIILGIGFDTLKKQMI